jgi:2-haloacid dehalogenase
MIEAISFDCYGTLIDWEKGILGALKPLLKSEGIKLEDKDMLKLYAELETKAESGEYMPYRDVLRAVVREMGERLGFTPSLEEQDCIAESMRKWKPFPDTKEALHELKKNFRLAVISNTDEDLIAVTLKKLDVDFDWVITAERTRSYKPSLNNFRLALSAMGLPPDRVLHAAHSIYHDIIPAKRLEMNTAFIRRGSKENPGADMNAEDLIGLARILKVGDSHLSHRKKS